MKYVLLISLLALTVTAQASGYKCETTCTGYYYKIHEVFSGGTPEAEEQFNRRCEYASGHVVLGRSVPNCPDVNSDGKYIGYCVIGTHTSAKGIATGILEHGEDRVDTSMKAYYNCKENMVRPNCNTGGELQAFNVEPAKCEYQP